MEVKTQEGIRNPQRIPSEDTFWPETEPLPFWAVISIEKHGNVSICLVGLLSAHCHWITAAVTEPGRKVCPKFIQGASLQRLHFLGFILAYFPLGFKGGSWKENPGTEVGLRDGGQDGNSGYIPDRFCRNSQSYKNPYFLLMVFKEPGKTKWILSIRVQNQS